MKITTQQSILVKERFIRDSEVTQQKIYSILRSKNFKKGSKSCSDYSKAKQIIFQKFLTTSTEYEIIAKWISDYFNI